MMLMRSKVYQLKLSLNGISPEIWRRIYVTDNISLANFHKIIQTTMGWFNSYSYYFGVGDMIFGSPDEDIDDLRIDLSSISLRQILRTERKSLTYHYDPVELWEVRVELERVLPRNMTFKNPVCSEGERSAPPEDCGGLVGYKDLVRVLANKDDPKFEEYSAWVGKEFDPEYFNFDEINSYLSSADYGSPEADEDFDFLEDDVTFDMEPV